MEYSVIIGFTVASLIALSRIIKALEPLWSRVPKEQRWILPAAVALAPVLASTLVNISHGGDPTDNLVALAAFISALLAPSHHAESN
jgi:hypothetical protein